MNTYWVYENIRKQASFYNELDVLLLLSSASQWKRLHPNFQCILYADKLTIELLENLNTTNLWDNIRTLPDNKHIDKNVFWASSKLEVLRFIEGPSILMDHDFIVYRNLEKYLKDKPFFAHEENGVGYYDTSWNPTINKVKDIINRPRPLAINCCFTYYPDDKFVNFYAKKSIELMEFFTKEKVPNSRFLIFAEQLLLKHLLDIHNIDYDTLLKEKWNAKNKVYEPSDKGYFTFEESNLIYRHYWMDKPKIKESKEGFDLNQEITILKNILSRHKDIKYDKKYFSK